jgi:hypothetical protein
MQLCRFFSRRSLTANSSMYLCSSYNSKSRIKDLQGIEYHGGYLFASVTDVGIIRVKLNGPGQTK